ncbi:MAG: sigma-E factor negative regulatory protein [Thiotrichaceae bacterium]|nr:sigma-E factor negative regulatory protein [Thiotrichaceae bacterium]PCI14346.1 MAG: hypothetical protein COB71_03220 [Thiotrichales bacterium]
MSKVETASETAAGSLQEKISSMVDGELSREEYVAVISEVSAGSGSVSWDQYHLIGEAMRHNLPDMLYPDLSTKISAAIASESAHQGGAATQATTDNPDITNVVAAVTQIKSPVFGYAIAASISVIAMVGLFQVNQEASLPPMMTPITVAHQPQMTPAPILDEISWRHQETPEPAIVQSRYPYSPIPAEKLNRYIISHNEHSIAMPSQGAMLPYVRLVGYEARQ